MFDISPWDEMATVDPFYWHEVNTDDEGVADTPFPCAVCTPLAGPIRG